MPCPVFCPTRVADRSLQLLGRLPLIDQYEGICTAHSEPYAPDQQTLFRYCNQGYSNGCCSRYPIHEEISCLRYSITRRTSEALQVICVEETAHEPRRWHHFEYLLQASDLKGEAPTECMRAQAIAFCQSYLRLLSEQN